MIIEAAVLTLVATSYLVPLIITCVIAAVTIIATGVTSYYTGRWRSNKESAELERLHAELLQREVNIRDAATSLAEDTQNKMDNILQQTQAQQTHINNNLAQLDEYTLQMDQNTKQIEQSTKVIDQISNDFQFKTDNYSADTEKLIEEINTLNQKMKETQRTLQDTEQLLANTLIELSTAQQSLALSMQQGNEKIITVTQQLTDVSVYFTNSDIEKLRNDNIQMAKNIKELEQTLTKLSLAYKTISQTNRTQFSEINQLHEENKRLHTIILKLTNELNESPPMQANHNPGFFK